MEAEINKIILGEQLSKAAQQCIFIQVDTLSI